MKNRKYYLFIIIPIAFILLIYLVLQFTFSLLITEEFITKNIKTSFKDVELEIDEVQAIFPSWIKIQNIRISYKKIFIPQFNDVLITVPLTSIWKRVPNFKIKMGNEFGNFVLETKIKKNKKISASIHSNKVNFSKLEIPDYKINGFAKISFLKKGDSIKFELFTDSFSLSQIDIGSIKFLQNTSLKTDYKTERNSQDLLVRFSSEHISGETDMYGGLNFFSSSQIEIKFMGKQILLDKGRIKFDFQKFDLGFEKGLPYYSKNRLFLDKLESTIDFNGDSIRLNNFDFSSNEINLSSKGNLLLQENFPDTKVNIFGHFSVKERFLNDFKNSFIIKLFLADAIFDKFYFKISGDAGNPKFEKIGRLK